MKKIILISTLLLTMQSLLAQGLIRKPFIIRYGNFDQTHGWAFRGNSGTLHLLNYTMTDSINMYLKTLFGVGINVQTVTASGDANISGNINSWGNLIFNAERDIYQNTSDGSDNRRFRLGSGGGVGDSRGAAVWLYGNEHSTDPGELMLRAGNVGGGDISFWTNGAAHWRIRQDSSDALYGDAGIVVGSPTGGYRGVGTINAVAVYDDNTLLTDFVFEQGHKYLGIRETERFYKEKKHLPTIDGRAAWEKDGRPSLGKIVSQLWETIEIQQLHLTDLQNQIDSLKISLGMKK